MSAERTWPRSRGPLRRVSCMILEATPPDRRWVLTVPTQADALAWEGAAADPHVEGVAGWRWPMGFAVELGPEGGRRRLMRGVVGEVLLVVGGPRRPLGE